MVEGASYAGLFRGFKVMTSYRMVDRVEDWSRVRSPARAKRRRQKHPQNICVYLKPKPDALRHGNTLYMHPETYRALREAIPT